MSQYGGGTVSQYKTLRSWAAFMSLIGVVGVVLVVIATVAWAVDVEGFWATLGVICIGAPLAVFLATWPFALSQMMRAVADVGDAVAR
jgi:hypothetical protein